MYRFNDPLWYSTDPSGLGPAKESEAPRNPINGIVGREQDTIHAERYIDAENEYLERLTTQALSVVDKVLIGVSVAVVARSLFVP